MSGARHHRPVGDQQVGATFRAARIRSGKRQQDVATGAGVHRSCVSSVERGHFGDVPLRQLRAIATDLEIQLQLVASWHGADGVRIVNERHSRMHELVAERLAVLSDWGFASEVSFSEWGERGVVDIFAWHSLTRTLLIIELKTEVPDPAGLVAQLDRYRRLGPAIGRTRGWDPLRVATWVFVAESDLNRRQVARHNVMLRNAFPLDGHFVRRWLRDPSAGSVRSTRHADGGSSAARGLADERPGAAGGARLGGIVAPSRVDVPSRVDGLSFLAYAAGGDTNGRLGPTKRVSRRRATPGAASSLVNDAQARRMRGSSASAAGSGPAAGSGVEGDSR
jgi:transcriptional regulator with XRE-family HTH domain